jgi:hypothetical protein
VQDAEARLSELLEAGLNEGHDAADLAEAVMVTSRRCSSLPDLDTRSAAAILGYDGGRD